MLRLVDKPGRPHDHPLAFANSPLAHATRQPMMLCLFLPTQTGGFSRSTLPRGTRWDFDYNRTLTLYDQSCPARLPVDGRLRFTAN
jgi:hypothetical protein